MTEVRRDIQALINATALGRPMADIMRGYERAAGNTPIAPGSVPWLSAADWSPDIVVSVCADGITVRLIAIDAIQPGTGAFRRLIAAMLAAGLRPVVVEPREQMTAILRRWGWRRRNSGYGWEHEERWTPKQGWKLPPPKGRR